MAKWTRAYMDDLPDSAFLLVLPGGKKDDDGKTVPRTKREFPVRDASGTIDKDHLDNALARIPQSNLSETLKDRATAKAEKLLSEWKKAHKVKKSMGSMSYNDLRSELQSIVQQKYGKKSKDGSYWMDYPYIVDIYEDEFVVEKDGKYYIADYDVAEDSTVEIGDFYPAHKIYNKSGNKPVKAMGKGAGKSLMVDRG